MNRFNRFIWCGIAAIAIGGFAVFNVSLNSQTGSSTIYMANVEALTGEGSYQYINLTLDCYKNAAGGAIKTGSHVACILGGIDICRATNCP
ncbi:MAG: hypothetical protein LBG80_05275 [Bacteroidales bacterium]|jgi:hypothetical protein|nr:hypothetical protein [Bacteroidales bacterium]